MHHPVLHLALSRRTDSITFPMTGTSDFKCRHDCSFHFLRGSERSKTLQRFSVPANQELCEVPLDPPAQCKHPGKPDHSHLEIFRHTDYVPGGDRHAQSTIHRTPDHRRSEVSCFPDFICRPLGLSCKAIIPVKTLPFADSTGGCNTKLRAAFQDNLLCCCIQSTTDSLNSAECKPW